MSVAEHRLNGVGADQLERVTDIDVALAELQRFPVGPCPAPRPRREYTHRTRRSVKRSPLSKAISRTGVISGGRFDPVRACLVVWTSHGIRDTGRPAIAS